MTTLLEWNGAGLANGANVAAGTAGTGDTPVTGVSSTPPTIVTGGTKTPAIRVSVAGAANNAYWTLGAQQSEIRVRVHFKTPATWPASTVSVVALRQGASTVSCNFSLTGTSGVVRMVDNLGASKATSGAILTTDTWYRLEFIVNVNAGTARYVLFLGDSTTALTGGDSGNVAGTYVAVDRVLVGTVNTTPTTTFDVAHAKATDTVATEVGVYTPPSSGGGGGTTPPVGTARTLIRWHGSGLANGAPLAASSAGSGDTPVTGVNGTAPTISTSDTKTPAIVYTMVTGAQSNVYWDLASGQTKFRGRFYVKTPSAWPSSPFAVLSISDAVTLADSLKFVINGSLQPGTVKLTAGDGANLATSQAILSLSTWYRVEVALDTAAGTARYYVYAGDATTALADSGDVTGAFGSVWSRVRLGVVVATQAVNFSTALLSVTDNPALEIGVFPVATGAARVYNGASEVVATTKAWSGTAEVAATLSLVVPGGTDPVQQLTREVGVYSSGGDWATSKAFESNAKVMAFYKLWNQGVDAAMRAAAQDCRSLLFSILTKQNATTFIRWENITAGNYDAYLTGLIRDLDELGITVWFALDQEPDIRLYSPSASTSDIAPNQTGAQYKAAMDKLSDLIHATSTSGRVKSLWWVSGWNTTDALAVMPTKAKTDGVGWDPYKSGNDPASRTASDELGSFVNRVIIPQGWQDKVRHIPETGIALDNATYTESVRTAWWDGMSTAMETFNIQSLIYFRTNSGQHPYIDTAAGPVAAFHRLAEKYAQPFGTTPGGGGGGGDTTARRIATIGLTLTSLGDPDVSGVLDENSGLVASTKSPGIFWGHGDSGNPNAVYAFDASGTIRATLTLSGVTNSDWEDISRCVMPDGTAGLMIGDIGSGAGTTRRFHRFAEPAVTIGQTPVSTTITAIDTFTYTSPVTDSEAFFVVPAGRPDAGNIILFEKRSGQTARPQRDRVYQIPASQLGAGGGTVTPTLIGSIVTILDSTNSGGLTAADIAPDGSAFMYVNYQEAWVTNLNAGQTVADALLANPEGQVRQYWAAPTGGSSAFGSESITFNYQPGDWFTLSEGVASSLKRGNFTYTTT